MKIGILSTFFLAIACVAGAGTDDTLIAFSTKGPDRYADGTTVLDGECYALVWSIDGNFDGFSADGRIHHRKQAGGHSDKTNSSQIGCCGKPG